MLHFILGRVRCGKTSFIINEIKKRHEKGTLLLVPEPCSHSMERLLCEVCGNSVSSFAEVTNFRRLATKIKGELGGIAAEIVSGGKRTLLLHAAISSTLPNLSTLGKTVKNPDRLADVLSAIDEFKAYGISPEKVMEAKNYVSKSLGDKLSDLALIYAAYEAELGEGEYDAYDELAHTAKLLEKGGFFENKTLFLDGFSGFNSAEFDIIEKALVSCKDVYIALDLPREIEEEAENGIFDNSAKTKKRLLELCQRNNVAYDERYFERSEKSALSHLDSALFSDTLKEYKGEDCEITVARAGGAFEECEMAAAYILDKVSLGARFRDFSIFLADEERYTGICERVFSRYGIPVYISRAKSLTSKPIISLVLAAFECVLRGFRTDTVMQYLKTGFSGVSAGSLDIFENYLYTWSPSPSQWARSSDFSKNPLGLTAEETEESKRLLRIVNRVRRKVCEPIKRLSSSLSRSGTGEEFAEALYEFINEINLPRRCAAYAYVAEISGRISDAREYEGVIKILYDAIDSLGRVIGERKITKEEFCHLFKLVVSDCELATIPTTIDCVNVEKISRAGGMRCKFCVILGAGEGSFPKASDGGGLLSDNDRAELSDYGIELAPGLAEQIFEEYRIIHDAICSGEEGLYISSCSVLENGEISEEASVVSRIRDIFAKCGEGIPVQEARLRAKVPLFDESIASGRSCSFFENDEGFSEKLCRVRESSKLSRGPIIDKENINAIFGKKIKLSASRADVFSSCRYAYFLKYGLYAKPHEKAEISALSAGTLMHYVLEKVISKLCESEGFNEEKAIALAGETCREYVSEVLGIGENPDGRMGFLLSRVEKAVKQAAADICRELSKSKFRPSEFELDFSKDGELPPLEVKGGISSVELRGAVDRVDTYEHDGKLYFRVIDYKSGKKEFKLDETINGIGMQLLLYMFALEEMGAERYGKELSPAGVMYVPLTPKPSETRGKQVGIKRREGVVLSDRDIIDAMEVGEEKAYIPVSFDKKGAISSSSSVLSRREFNLVKERMREVLAKIGDELCSGIVEPNPYVNKNRTSCDHCDYKSVCAFDEVRGDDKKRELIELRVCDVLKNSGGEEDGKRTLD